MLFSRGAQGSAASRVGEKDRRPSEPGACAIGNAMAEIVAEPNVSRRAILANGDSAMHRPAC
jgi:hypothetical protein